MISPFLSRLQRGLASEPAPAVAVVAVVALVTSVAVVTCLVVRSCLLPLHAVGGVVGVLLIEPISCSDHR